MKRADASLKEDSVMMSASSGEVHSVDEEEVIAVVNGGVSAHHVGPLHPRFVLVSPFLCCRTGEKGGLDTNVLMCFGRCTKMTWFQWRGESSLHVLLPLIGKKSASATCVSGYAQMLIF